MGSQCNVFKASVLLSILLRFSINLAAAFCTLCILFMSDAGRPMNVELTWSKWDITSHRTRVIQACTVSDSWRGFKHCIFHIATLHLVEI